MIDNTSRSVTSIMFYSCVLLFVGCPLICIYIMAGSQRTRSKHKGHDAKRKNTPIIIGVIFVVRRGLCDLH
jgi:hypothetical protein